MKKKKDKKKSLSQKTKKERSYSLVVYIQPFFFKQYGFFFLKKRW
jgi:hypothetical protein